MQLHSYQDHEFYRCVEVDAALAAKNAEIARLNNAMLDIMLIAGYGLNLDATQSEKISTMACKVLEGGNGCEL